MSYLREAALDIFQRAIEAVEPRRAIARHLQLAGEELRVGLPGVAGKAYDLRRYERLLVVGGGKAGASMAQGLEEVLGNRITMGRVVVKYGHRAEGLKRVGIQEAGHPLPDEAGLRGAREVLDLLRSCGERDLVFCLISGGASALLPLPSEGISLQEKQQVTQLLLGCGARIGEVNAVRKHLSRLKGGQLARWAHPAALISLVLSDAVGDPLDTIASGPTAPDPTTFAQCREILTRYGLWEKVPPAVRALLLKGKEETPKPGDPLFERVQHLIVGNNRMALQAAQQRAEQLGFRTLLLSSFVEGESREVAKVHAAIAKEILSSGHPIGRPACVVSGGETTVTLRGTGQGGRNQEFALAAALEIAGWEGVVILSGGTDGTDGPTDAAGAIVDGRTVQRARQLGLDPEAHLAGNDAYPFFGCLGDLLMTGPTRTNVMDVQLILIAHSS